MTNEESKQNGSATKLAEATPAVVGANSDPGNVQTELTELKLKLAEATSATDNVQKELTELKLKLAEATPAVVGANSDPGNVQTELTELKLKLAEATSATDNVQKELTELKLKLAEATPAVVGANSDPGNVQTELTELKLKLAEATSATDNVQKELTELKLKLAEATPAVVGANSDPGNVQTELTELKLKLAEATSATDNVQKELTELKLKLAEATPAVVEANSDPGNVQTELTELKLKLAEATSATDNVQKELTELKLKLAEATPAVVEANSDPGNVQTELTELKLKLAEATSATDNVQTELTELKLKLAEATPAVVGANSDPGNVQTELTELKLKLAEATSATDNVQTELTELKLKLAEATPAVVGANSDPGNVQTELTELKLKLAEATSATDNVQTELTELKLNVTEATSEIGRVKIDLAELKLKLAETNSKLDQASSSSQQTKNVNTKYSNSGQGNTTRINRLIKILIIVIIVIIPAIIAWFLIGKYSPSPPPPPPPEACDMNIAANRDFNKYYGILNTTNHFTTSSADKCDSNIIFKLALPQTILKSDHTPSSFLTLAPFGTGKTLLRCEYYKSLTSSTYFKVLILNRQINEYFERFVKEKSIHASNCDTENCLKEWSKFEFGQLLLSLLVTQFVNTFDKEEFYVPNISINEKIELITIICYYYNEPGVTQLENFVNFFLKKTDSSLYSANKAEVQVQERHFYRDKLLLTNFKNDLKKLSAIKQDYEKLHLLLAIVEGESFQHKIPERTMSDNVFNDLKHFALFIKTHLKRVVVFIIDGIDENRFLFAENQVNTKALEIFYRSSISEEILLATLPDNFYLSLFYPKIDGINIQDATIKGFAIDILSWNTRLLIDYADYILEEMNKKASSNRCKSFKDFKTLVNYTNMDNQQIINRILTPRALHAFVSELIKEMNDCATDGLQPFIATFRNIQDAYKKSRESIDKHDINAK